MFYLFLFPFALLLLKEEIEHMPVLYSKQSNQFFIRLERSGKRTTFFKNPETGLPFRTKTEAKNAEAMLLTGAGSEKKPSSEKKHSSEKIRCETLFGNFKEQMSRRVKNTTVNSKMYQFKNRIVPQFNGRFVEDITNDDLELMNGRLNKIVPWGSRDNCFSLCRQWVTYLRKYNPTLLPEKFFAYKDVKVHKHVYHLWTREQEAHFLSFISDPSDKLLFTLLVDYGFRITEVLALRYEDIDFNRMTLSVNRIVTVKSGDHKQVFQTPKTKNSIRTLPIVADVASILPHKASGYVFPGKESVVVGEMTLRKKNTKYAKMAGVKAIKIHEFRHSCASNLLRGNQSIRLVARWLGDTESTISNFYSHLFGDEEDAISKWIDAHPIKMTSLVKESSDN